MDFGHSGPKFFKDLLDILGKDFLGTWENIFTVCSLMIEVYCPRRPRPAPHPLPWRACLSKDWFSYVSGEEIKIKDFGVQVLVPPLISSEILNIT